MLISPTFFVSWSQRKWGKEISGSLRLAATTMPSRPSTEPLLPAAILAAEIGSLRRPDASQRPCVRLLSIRSSLRAFRAPLKGSKVSVHSSLPLSVPRRGNLLLSFQRDKRSKTASAFFVLGTQRNPNQRKVIHLIILAQCAATIRPRLRVRPADAAEAVQTFRSDYKAWLPASSLHYSTSRLGGELQNLRNAEILESQFTPRQARRKSSVFVCTLPCAPPEPRFGS